MEAISVMLPFSMNSKSVCCCFLLKYWISSRYSKTPFTACSVFTCATTSRISAVEAVVPFNLHRCMWLCFAMMDATVVFPTPDGP